MSSAPDNSKATAPQASASEATAPQVTLPRAGASAAAVSQGTASLAGAPQATTQVSGAPEAGAQRATAPQTAARQIAASQTRTPPVNTPAASTAPVKLDVPWQIHAYVWIFMVAFGLSPLLLVVAPREQVDPANGWYALMAVGLLQSLFWVAQLCCSTRDLTYWEGLLIAAASVETGVFMISLPLSFFVLLFTVAESFLFAFSHDPSSPTRNATLCYGKLIIAIHRSRLWRRR